MATAKKTETIEVKPLRIEKMNIRIVGDTPFIVHAWSEKAKKEMLDAQQSARKKTKRPYRDPFDEFAKSLYWLTPMPQEEWTDPLTGEKRMRVTEELFDKAIKEGARFGFPANSFKQAANSAAYRMGEVPNQMALRSAYFLNDINGGELVEMKGSVPMCREDMVKVGQGTADLRYRGMFDTWYCDMVLEFNANGKYTKAEIIDFLNKGGYGVGVGEWRPEHDGMFGRFHVEAIGK